MITEQCYDFSLCSSLQSSQEQALHLVIECDLQLHHLKLLGHLQGQATLEVQQMQHHLLPLWPLPVILQER